MGKNIVYQEECAKECGKHKRLLLFEDINNILTQKKKMVRCYFENLSTFPFILFNREWF